MGIDDGSVSCVMLKLFGFSFDGVILISVVSRCCVLVSCWLSCGMLL